MKKLKFEDQSKNWKIWDKKSAIERTFQRVQKTLPEMESAKQLLKILKPILLRFFDAFTFIIFFSII